MTDWNYADVWETAAEVQPAAPAVVQGGRQVPWGELDRDADGVAAWLLALGVVRQSKVAVYLYNCPEYVETVFAACKVGLVPVNTNYRYTDDELVYLWDNADAVAVVFHGTFAATIERIRARVPRVAGWLWVDDGSGPCPSWASPWAEAAKSASRRVAAPWGRSGDDLIMTYTGGTTGMPKGVMWRQDDVFARLNGQGFRRYPADGGIGGVRAELEANGPGQALLPACPLMHGTGGYTANECLAEGGRVVLLEGRRFDAEELLDTIERERVDSIVIVGDPFARPLLEALDAHPDRWDLSSLGAVISSGAMWSGEVKARLGAYVPDALLVDSFASSEAVGMGVSVSSGSSARTTAEFSLSREVVVLGRGDRPIEPGSDEVGVLAIGGRNPVGYYKDDEKTARTFRVVNGVRYSVPGDYATVRADGSIHLLGRGSASINTAGEKVFPEEVEEALKTHRSVEDAVVVGVPHPRFGEQVVAVVEPARGAEVDEQALVAHVKARLAGFKAPRRVRVVESIGRAANGKVDYGRHRREAAAWMAEAGEPVD